MDTGVGKYKSGFLKYVLHPICVSKIVTEFIQCINHYDTLENIRAGRRQGTTPMITSATQAYTERRAAAAATEAAAEAADGWTVVCSRRKRK